MKKKVSYVDIGVINEKEINYIPVRYFIATAITLTEILVIIGIVIFLCFKIPYFYIAAWLTQIFCVVRIASSDDNPDYKVPWLLIVLTVPIGGFMLYFLFYSRKLKRKYVKRLGDLKNGAYKKDDTAELELLTNEDIAAASQAKMICNIAETHLFKNTLQVYFPLGEDMHRSMLVDLQEAEKFIFLEYFIIEEGIFWDSILDILKEKARKGVEIKIVYDDIGCMKTLPGDYSKQLRAYGIDATPFSRLRGNADNEFNNRNHRKILVIDGKIGYTGGINIADEYINERERFGHWKDTGIRLEGDAVLELTKLFLIDYGMNVKHIPMSRNNWFPASGSVNDDGFLIPFGDGPRPIYNRRIGKTVIQNMLANATDYVYMTTPYLIIDNGLCTSIENAALRGVKIKIVVPHIPDKKIIFAMTRSFYPRLMKAGVEIYEYEPGFIHAKSYIADGKYAVIGTINLDYRSLVHHFENAVWMYRCSSINDMKEDFEDTLSKCIKVRPNMLKLTLSKRFLYSVVRIFSPLL